MMKKNIYASLITDVVTIALLTLLSYSIYFLYEAHPLTVFVSTYTLEYLQLNPSILPSEFVLYSGLISYAALGLLGIIGTVLLLFFSRFYLYKYLTKERISKKTGLKLYFLQGFLVLLPVSIIAGIVLFLGNIFIYLLPEGTLAVFIQQGFALFIIAIVAVLLTTFSLYFYKKKVVFAFFSDYISSLDKKAIAKIGLYAVGVFAVFFLLEVLLLSNFKLFYQLESAIGVIVAVLFLTFFRIASISTIHSPKKGLRKKQAQK